MASTSFSLPCDDASHIFAPALCTFAAFYYILSPWYNIGKQRAWILTAISSFAMSAASIPFMWDYLLAGASISNVRTSSKAANYVIRAFQAYLVSDLAIGALHYREHVNLLSGWIHHFLYVFVVEFAIRRSWAHIFCLCAVMEFPTFFMAVACLHPRLRSDALFAGSFFMTRIVLHVVLIVSYSTQSNRMTLLNGSFLPSVLLACAFPMHALWFTGCVKGMLRRSRVRKAALADLKAAAPSYNMSGSQVPSEKLATANPVAAPSLRRSKSMEASLSLRSEDYFPRTTDHTPYSSTTLPKPLRIRALQADPFRNISTHTPVRHSREAMHTFYTPPRPLPPTRRTSFDRALRTFEAVQGAKLELARVLRKIQDSHQFREFQRARQSVYARLPDRKIVFDYVGLAPSPIGAREVTAY